MTTFLNILFASLETGSVFALAALGIVLIFRTSKTTNFAQGTIGTFNAYIVASVILRTGISIWLGAVVGILTSFLTGIIIDTFIIRPAAKVSPIAKQIITLGIIMVMVGLLPYLFGVNNYQLDRFFASSNKLDVLGATLQINTIFVVVLSLILMGILFYVIQKTRWGLATRVTAADETTSKLMGVPTKRVTMISWATAAVFGTLAAIFIAPRVGVSANMLVTVQISAFFAGTLGGFSTFYGPVIGAFIIAALRNFTMVYVSDIWGNVIVYTLILIFLYIKPYGLFGKKPTKKV